MEFLNFRPGLVGGHCIGVDPYYLTHKAEALGYNSQVILAGRRINDGMGSYVASATIKEMLRKYIQVKDSKVLVLGLAFKENCPDLRNTRSIDVVRELQQYGVHVDVHDPWVSAEGAKAEYGIELVQAPEKGFYDAIVLLVAHDEYKEYGVQKLKKFGCENHVFCDVKSIFLEADSDFRL